jgi:hypothetical protein
VTGGRLFEYDNIEVLTHVERRINNPEAAVVREIFRLCAVGYGTKGIAKQLNEAGALAPRPRPGGSLGWAPSTIHDALARELYRGVIVAVTVCERLRLVEMKQSALIDQCDYGVTLHEFA